MLADKFAIKSKITILILNAVSKKATLNPLGHYLNSKDYNNDSQRNQFPHHQIQG